MQFWRYAQNSNSGGAELSTPRRGHRRSKWYRWNIKTLTVLLEKKQAFTLVLYTLHLYKL